jgi:hypothetical protein
MNYKIAFSEIFSENRDERPAEYLARDLDYDLVVGKATVFTGVRRAGKSTFLRQIVDQNKKWGPVLQVNFIDERLLGIGAQHLNQMFDAFCAICPDFREDGPLVLMLDEIQIAPDWELFVERQLRRKQRRILITGSSSKLLSEDIATSMRGRSIRYEIFPFALDEWVKWSLKKDFDFDALTREQKARMGQLVSQYLTTGGFPEVINCSGSTRIRILQEYFEVLLYRDVIERHDVSLPLLAKNLFHLLVSQFAGLVSFNKLVERLKAQGFATTRQYIAQLSDWLCDAYGVFFIPVYSESVHRQNTNPKKVYVIDTGLINAVVPEPGRNSGRMLENAVFIALRRFTKSIFYYRTQEGLEVDFFLPDKTLIQVCWSLDDPDTKDREVAGLVGAAAERGIKIGYIVTHSEEAVLHVAGMTIHVIPSWKILTTRGAQNLLGPRDSKTPFRC